jgi:hypothetical protein
VNHTSSGVSVNGTWHSNMLSGCKSPLHENGQGREREGSPAYLEGMLERLASHHAYDRGQFSTALAIRKGSGKDNHEARLTRQGAATSGKMTLCFRGPCGPRNQANSSPGSIRLQLPIPCTSFPS